VVELATVDKTLGEALDLYASGLTQRAHDILTANVRDVKTAQEAKEVVGIARVGWCGDESCGKEIQNVTEKTVLGVPLDVAFQDALKVERLALPGKGYSGVCASCGKATTTPIHVAKTY